MDPIITPAEMQAIDGEAAEPVEELIERAGWAVARAAVALLGRRYGARVLIIAGKGNNGADGRSAAHYLTSQGVRCQLVTADAAGALTPSEIALADLVIDAAYGTGFRGTWEPPLVGATPVLAVDIPSGVDGLTGQATGQPLAAEATITFAAVKPGLLLHPGRGLAGRVEVADIGLDCSRAQAWLLGPDDLETGWPHPLSTTHKWQRAIWIIGGSPAMPGAPCLAAAGAARAGASYVGLSIPGLAVATPPVPIEAVLRPVDTASSGGTDSPGGAGWSAEVIAGCERFGALVIGPGLTVDEVTGSEVRAVVGAPATVGLPIVLDGGAIDAVVADPSVLAGRTVPAVLTPHDGELARLLGHRPGPDRLREVRQLAARLGAVIVAKGPTTVVVEPGGKALISTAGDQRLATAGTGDVLAGLVGAALAGGLDPLRAGGLGAELHGRAALDGSRIGLVAGDLPPLVAHYLARWSSSGGMRPMEGGNG
ncbi:MAG: bifunctional ADP-dependent NAD(P)H-hydrate dehydratase/NAD(P)H-hydrate epimerase [Actinomycetia bacterium]|nr:bifunctional ADP-dependent NAD(P)H-hydrate dehydratase/NAD(P)H-hydrate epimerase [Actinomycetes bacterium]